MEFVSSLISEEYERYCKQLNGEDPYKTEKTLGIHDVLRAHFLVTDYFGAKHDLEGVGGIGPKSLDLLHSALYRQHIGFEHYRKFASDLELVATLMFGLIKNHPFHDANKRTAFLSALFHLRKLKRIPDTSQKNFEDLTVRVAENNLKQYRRFARIARESDEAEVKFIADFFRRYTRIVDKRHYDLTFQQLNTILGRYKCSLENPRHNQIDVVRYESSKRLFGFGKESTYSERVCKIGFPNWKEQVPKSIVKKVRRELGLTEKNGYDSKAFYQDADPIPTLISRYEPVLRRLADR